MKLDIHLKGRLFYISVLSIILFSTSAIGGVPPIPARIGGLVIADGNQLTQTTDTGYTFVITKQDGTAYVPAAEDKDGLNTHNWYVIDIPVYDQNNQPGGAKASDKAVIHVYKEGKELNVVSPAKGELTVGESGSRTRINLVVKTSPDKK